MHLKPMLSAAVFAAMTVLSLGVQAADAGKAEPGMPAGEMQADKAPAPQKKVKPHSHMEEKTGMQPAPASPGKPDAGKDQSKHSHPRDMK